jgi:serine phosphatase RsbU (regulator of sigma subunit)
LTSIVAIFWINNQRKQRLNRLLSFQKQEIEEQRDSLSIFNKEMTSSLLYAQRLQQAMLPSVLELQNLLPESFLMYQPKNIVSGDFYWLYAIDFQKVIVAVADCTGHGVPGALMSVMSIDLLNKVIVEKKIHEPHLILKQMHLEICKQLDKENYKNADGIEIGVCLIDRSQNKLHYAGAMMPLYYIEKIEKNQKLEMVESKRSYVGGLMYDNTERDFYTQTIDIQKDTTFYLFSDGFQDQMGGENDKRGRKFSSKRLKQILVENNHKTLKEQKQLLSDVLTGWQGENNQTDDIIALAFRLKVEK